MVELNNGDFKIYLKFSEKLKFRDTKSLQIDKFRLFK